MVSLLKKKKKSDDIVLHENVLVQAKSLLHSLEQAARGIGLSVNFI